MKRSRSRTWSCRATTAGAGLLLLAGCSGSGSLDRAEIERQVSEQLTQEVGQKPDSIRCPDDLPAETGATMRCTLTAGGDSLGVTLIVTSVDGSKASFDIEVDEQ